MHNDEVHDFYSSSDIIQVVKSRRKEGRGLTHVWERETRVVGKLEGRSPFERPGRRWEHNIKTGLNGI